MQCVCVNVLPSIVVIRCNEGSIEDFDTLDGCSYKKSYSPPFKRKGVEGKSNHMPR